MNTLFALLASVLLTSGNLSATGSSATFQPKESSYIQTKMPFNYSISGTFVGTVVLEKSFDGGTTWLQAYDSTGTAISYTAPKNIILEEPEAGVLYRVRCSAYTSGTISYRLSR